MFLFSCGENLPANNSMRAGLYENTVAGLHFSVCSHSGLGVLRQGHTQETISLIHCLLFNNSAPFLHTLLTTTAPSLSVDRSQKVFPHKDFKLAHLTLAMSFGGNQLIGLPVEKGERVLGDK